MSAILYLCIFDDGSPSNINYYVLRKLCAKFGAFIRSVTITLYLKLSNLTINDRTVDNVVLVRVVRELSKCRPAMYYTIMSSINI